MLPASEARRQATSTWAPSALARWGGSGSDQAKSGEPPAEAAQRLFALTNEARSAAGVAPLVWDATLATAAERHCRLMATRGALSHRFADEPGLAERATRAGARFWSLEENVALGPSTDAIQQEWMRSPPHRANLLNAAVNRVGVAVVPGRDGSLYAVTDFAAAAAAPALSH